MMDSKVEFKRQFPDPGLSDRVFQHVSLANSDDQVGCYMSRLELCFKRATWVDSLSGRLLDTLGPFVFSA